MNTMRKIVFITIIITYVLHLSACSYLRVRHSDVQQGNIVTQAMLNSLRSGMTPEQVSYILGTPVLSSTLNKNVWTYVYTFQKGNRGAISKQHLYIHFKQGHLSTISGHYTAI